MKLRTSTLPEFADCARRASTSVFYQEIIDLGYEFNQRTNVPRIAPIVGTSVHAGAEHLLKQKFNGETPDLDGMIEFAITRLHEETADGIEYDDCSLGMNVAEKQIQRMSAVYFTMVMPKINLNAIVEQEYQVRLSDDMLLTGHPDVTVEHQIRDLKTGRLKNFMIQNGGYDLLVTANTDIVIQESIIDYIPRVKIDKEQPPAVEIHYNAEWCRNAAKSVLRSIVASCVAFKETSSPDVFVANPDSNICSGKYCRAYGTDYCRVECAT